MKYKKLNKKEFSELVAECKLLESEGEIPVVWQRGEEIIKRFRAQRRLSSNALNPYASRFADNSVRLIELGIAAPAVTAAYRLSGSADRVLVYIRVPGVSISDLAEPLVADRLAAIYADLHTKGVIFRSVHLSNILLDDHGRYGLIDITDVKFMGRPLTLKERAANLGYAWAHPRDADYFNVNRTEAVLDAYIRLSDLASNDIDGFRQALYENIASGTEKRRKRREKKAAKR